MYRRILSLILRDVLQREEVADDDNFFSLGLDSIKALIILDRIEHALGCRLELVYIFTHASIHALNEALLSGAQAQFESRVVPVAPRASYRTSPVQRGLYLMEMMASGQNLSTTPFVIAFDADLDPELAKAAFRGVLERHEPLRSVFAFAQGAPVQIVRPPNEMASAFVYTDLGAGEGASRSFEALYDAAVREPFNLERGPLVRFHLVRVQDTVCVALLSIHHIISDGFSVATIENDFRYFYGTVAGRPVIAAGSTECRPLIFQYKDYVYWLEDWLQSPSGRRSLNYWTEALAGVSPPSLFAAGERGPVSFAAANNDGALARETIAKLHDVSAEQEVTVFVVLLACIRTLLFLETGQGDSVIGVAVTTRDSVRLSGQIGPFVNTLPIRSRISGAWTFRRLVSLVNEAMLAALPHKLLPVEILADTLAGGAPLFDVGFTLQERRAPSNWEQEQGERDARPEGLAIKLLFIAYESPPEIAIRIRYQTAHFSPGEIVELREKLVRVIDAACGDVESTFGDLFDLPCAEAAFAIELDLD